MILKNLAIGGYRSFGSVQYFDKFAKINLFIGRNNSGKSNILRFINEIYSNIGNSKSIDEDAMRRHQPSAPPLIIGSGEYIEDVNDNNFSTSKNFRFNEKNFPHLNLSSRKKIFRILKEKSKLDNSSLCWTLRQYPKFDVKEDFWKESIKNLHDVELRDLWSEITGKNGGGRSLHWEPEVLQIVQSPISGSKSYIIPAIRQVLIDQKDSVERHDGSGIIDKLAKLQNPDVHNQVLRTKFSEINSFVQSVLDREDATIEIPYERNTILVHMDNKVLPLDSLGTGVHEVIILAAAATTLNDTILCIEEPELHLNPILQRKLLQYLSNKTSNQYFITTHSPAIMDTPGAEIYHITQKDGESKVTRATSDRIKSDACEDLGYHPSDLLQTNCVIWVEGPSDRIYIKYWLKHASPELTEGIHYSIMFYGGRLLSHLSGEENEIALDEFISLRKLNTRGVILIDSDKSVAQSHLNKTKKRLKEEFDKGPGFSWVTEGREIENYLSEEQIKLGIKDAAPNCTFNSSFGKYDNCLKIKGERGADTQASKTDVAHSITQKCEPNLEIFDLKKQINKLILFIKESNPATRIS